MTLRVPETFVYFRVSTQWSERVPRRERDSSAVDEVPRLPPVGLGLQVYSLSSGHETTTSLNGDRPGTGTSQVGDRYWSMYLGCLGLPTVNIVGIRE